MSEVPLYPERYASASPLRSTTASCTCLRRVVQLIDFCITQLSEEPLYPSVHCATRCAALKERCPPRQKSRVERLKAKVEPLLT